MIMEMETYYCQVVGMTDEQKREMYRKCTKAQLIDFLIEREKYDTVQINGTALKNYQELFFTSVSTT